MKNEESLRKIVAENLVKYRKSSKLTQSQLANIINYSDKAISKWERGESLPDIYTLSVIADYYGITVNDLLEEGEVKVRPQDTKIFTHIFVPLLSIGIAIFISILFFVGLNILTNSYSHLWMTFIYLIPVIGIIATVFSALWFNEIFQCASVSIIIWGVVLSIFFTLQIRTNLDALWLIFIIGGAFEIITILWFLMFYLKKRSNKNRKKDYESGNQA